MEFEIKLDDKEYLRALVPQIMEATGEDRERVVQRLALIVWANEVSERLPSEPWDDPLVPNDGPYMVDFETKEERLARQERAWQHQQDEREKFDRLYAATAQELKDAVAVRVMGPEQEIKVRAMNTCVSFGSKAFENGQEMRDWWMSPQDAFDGLVPFDFFCNGDSEVATLILNELLRMRGERHSAGYFTSFGSQVMRVLSGEE